MQEVDLGVGRLGSRNRLFGAGESSAECGSDFANRWSRPDCAAARVQEISRISCRQPNPYLR